MTKGIYSFYWDCSRMGDLEGIFIADSAELQNVIGKEIYFGEVLGKHSEIYGTVDIDDIKLLTDDQEFISKFEEIMGTGTISGYNPLDYIRDEEDGKE